MRPALGILSVAFEPVFGRGGGQGCWQDLVRMADPLRAGGPSPQVASTGIGGNKQVAE